MKFPFNFYSITLSHVLICHAIEPIKCHCRRKVSPGISRAGASRETFSINENMWNLCAPVCAGVSRSDWIFGLSSNFSSQHHPHHRVLVIAIIFIVGCRQYQYHGQRQSFPMCEQNSFSIEGVFSSVLDLIESIGGTRGGQRQDLKRRILHNRSKICVYSSVQWY